MHDRLFGNQNVLAAEQLPSHAQAVGLDAAKFKTCLETGKYAAKVRKDLAEAQKVGINGTPTFFTGLTDAKSSEIKGSEKDCCSTELRCVRNCYRFSARGTIIS
jgi:predicted DsbA family dithiol-disulfide isomerase